MKSKFLFIISMLTLLLFILACQAGGPIAAIFATDTPTPTNTPSPTPTPTVTPTPTFTPTPTPLPTGVEFETQTDETVVVTDYDNHYRMTLPKGWIVIPLTTDDFFAMADKLAGTNPELSEAIAAIQKIDSDAIRLVALNENPKYIQSGFTTNITITAVEDKLMSTMPIPFITAMLEDSMEKNGAKVLTSSANVLESKSGVEIGIVETEQTAVTATGMRVTAYSKYLVFQVAGKVVLVQLATPTDFRDELNPILESIAESIQILD
ncbi:MAG: hypothetical protein C4583_16195 [Anaerolineaceae bacterium]|nr:MAG: hypothetical protein C4583_16195 [Anaerolineaceae bacterium]